jgi:O-antigen/teichoic acid export membrane protein
MRGQILKNLSWLTVGNAVVKPVWFVFITWVCIRMMGLGEYGAMTATLGLMGILDGSLTLGTSDYSIREIARDRTQSSIYFSNFLPFRLVLSSLALGLGLLAEIAIGNSDLLVTALFAGTYVLMRNLTEYCRVIFRAHEDFRIQAFSTIWEKVFVVGLGTIFLFRVPSAASALMGMSLGMALTFVANYRWVTKKFADLRHALVQTSFFREGLPKAIPLGLASIFVLLFFRTDTVMIEAFKGELVTGQYALAFRVVEALLMLPAMVTMVLLPRLSDLFRGDGDEFRSLGKLSVLALFGISILISIVIAWLAPWIVRTLDPSPEAAPAVALMRILIWIFPLAGVNSILATILTASDRQHRLARALGIAAVINIALNLFLIPRYAAGGAAFATIVTQLLVGAMLLLSGSGDRKKSPASV